MKPTTTLPLAATLTALAGLVPPGLSPAEDKGKVPQPDIARLSPGEKFTRPVEAPPVPIIPKGSEETGEIRAAIVFIQAKLIDPLDKYSNSRALMSRALVRMDVQYHLAITDTSDSLFPFDVYWRHRTGTWSKIASGVCHPGMGSIKVAMPETGVMVDPAKHPMFAAALSGLKRSTEKRAG